MKSESLPNHQETLNELAEYKTDQTGVDNSTIVISAAGAVGAAGFALYTIAAISSSLERNTGLDYESGLPNISIDTVAAAFGLGAGVGTLVAGVALVAAKKLDYNNAYRSTQIELQRDSESSE